MFIFSACKVQWALYNRNVLSWSQTKLRMPALVANVDDIEDIVKYDDITLQDRVEAKKYVVPRTRKTRTPDSKVKNVETEEKVQAESYIPGTMWNIYCVCM